MYILMWASVRDLSSVSVHQQQHEYLRGNIHTSSSSNSKTDIMAITCCCNICIKRRNVYVSARFFSCLCAMRHLWRELWCVHGKKKKESTPRYVLCPRPGTKQNQNMKKNTQVRYVRTFQAKIHQPAGTYVAACFLLRTWWRVWPRFPPSPVRATAVFDCCVWLLCLTAVFDFDTFFPEEVFLRSRVGAWFVTADGIVGDELMWGQQ